MHLGSDNGITLYWMLAVQGVPGCSPDRVIYYQGSSLVSSKNAMIGVLFKHALNMLKNVTNYVLRVILLLFLITSFVTFNIIVSCLL